MTTTADQHLYQVHYADLLDVDTPTSGTTLQLATSHDEARALVRERMPWAGTEIAVDVQAEWDQFLRWCSTGEDPESIARGLTVCAGDRDGLWGAFANRLLDERYEAHVAHTAEASYLGGR